MDFTRATPATHGSPPRSSRQPRPRIARLRRVARKPRWCNNPHASHSAHPTHPTHPTHLAHITHLAHPISSFFHLSRGGKSCPRRGIGKPSEGFCRSLLYMKHILSCALVAVVVAAPVSAQSRLKLPPNLFAMGQA